MTRLVRYNALMLLLRLYFLYRVSDKQPSPLLQDHPIEASNIVTIRHIIVAWNESLGQADSMV